MQAQFLRYFFGLVVMMPLVWHAGLAAYRPKRIFGQFTQLTGWDPGAVALAVERGPRCVVWTQWMDDMGWWEVDGDQGWFARDRLPDTIQALLAELGRTYAPFMVANADAVRSGADEVVVDIDGHPYRQAPFPYQEKCLRIYDAVNYAENAFNVP